MRLIIPMIIQTIGLDPFRAVWTESASNLSSLVHKGLMVLCLSAVRNAAQTDIGHTE